MIGPFLIGSVGQHCCRLWCLSVCRICEDVVMTNVSYDRWLSVDEIAAYIGVKRDTVYKWIDRKKMPAHKVGCLWKFRKKEIDQWVRSGKAAAGNSKESCKPR